MFFHGLLSNFQVFLELNEKDTKQIRALFREVIGKLALFMPKDFYSFILYANLNWWIPNDFFHSDSFSLN